MREVPSPMNNVRARLQTAPTNFGRSKIPESAIDLSVNFSYLKFVIVCKDAPKIRRGEKERN
jgi:hypothetical protein